VVACDTVVLIPAGVGQHSRNQLFDHARQSRRPVGNDLGRVTVNSHGRGEERARRPDVPTLRDVHADQLGMLVDRPVQVAPDAGDLDTGSR